MKEGGSELTLFQWIFPCLIVLHGGSFTHLRVQLFITQPFNCMLSLATVVVALLYNEDVSFHGYCSDSGQEPMPWPSHLQEGLE